MASASDDGEPMFCVLCGALDDQCECSPYTSAPGDATEGPHAYCEISRCALWTPARCYYCNDDPGEQPRYAAEEGRSV